MKYNFTINLEVESETKSEAEQLVKDYLNEILSGTDWQEHDIKRMELKKQTYKCRMWSLGS